MRHSARLSPETVDGLPVWRIATLLVQMAARPSIYRDWPNVGDWLADAVARVDTDDIQQELQGQKRSAWARMAYLLDRGARSDWALDLLADAPRGTGPYYLGPRDRRGHFDARYDVIDSHLGASAAATS